MATQNPNLQITPENIAGIYIQYKPDFNQFGGVAKNFNYANIYVQYYLDVPTDSLVSYFQITLQQMLTYIQMLILKAQIANDGKVIRATQKDDFWTFIDIGLPYSGTLPNHVTLVTPNGVHDSDIGLVVNITDVTANVLNCFNSPAICEFLLPVINGDMFDNDYEVQLTNGTLTVVQASNNGAGFWDVVLCVMYPDANTNDVIVTCVQKNLTANVFFRNSGGTNIDSLDGVQNIPGDLIAVNGDGYKAQSDILGGAGDFAQPILNDEVSAFRLRQAGGIVSGTAQIKATFTVSSAQDMNVQTAGGNVQKITTTNVPVSGQQLIDAEYETVTPSTPPRTFGLYFNVVSGGAPTPPPVGVAVSAAAGNTGTSAALCPAPLTTYYTAAGNITTGVTVYTDINLTIPLAGFDFILSPDGNIYAIDNVTGVVGGLTGNSCTIPITGKNMFVVSSGVTTHLDVDGTDYGAQGVGVNYNVVIKSDSVITNNSGGSRTFKYYSSAPFIPANLITTVIVANGGTNTLPNNVSNYNYLVIS